jgi:Uma2 family endonuclease
MKEYIDNGVRLGILINRKSRQVEIYRPGKEVEVLESPATVSGEDVLNSKPKSFYQKAIPIKH